MIVATGRAIFLSLLVLVSLSCDGRVQNDEVESPGLRKEHKTLTVFHAGSLAVPFRQIADRFTAQYPEILVQLEAAGSRHCARKISDLGRRCDVMASADYTVIDELLIPDYALWNIRFATNEMAIVFSEHSRRREEIDLHNWYEVLLDPEIKFGRSDPDTDPCGYRAVLTMKLAEDYYQAEGLAGQLLAKDHRFIRPKETDLLSLLETGAIDYIFLYRSVADQHGLSSLLLPDDINLKSQAFAEQYSTVSVEVSGKTPGERIVKTGAPMVYGVTIPTNAPEPELAITFVRFLLDVNEGVVVMEHNGQPSIAPAVTDAFERLPVGLRGYAIPSGS